MVGNALLSMFGRSPAELEEPAAGVQPTSEFWRVVGLPTRTYSAQDTAYLVQEMTRLCKTPNGTMTLLDKQAIALFELTRSKGLFGGLGTGEGKTLISLLAPHVMGLWRPIVLLPAKLIAKTERERLHLAQHWKIPVTIRFESYEKLCRDGHVDLLELYEPDGIIADEAHKMRSPDAAVTKRVDRYLRKHRDTRCVFLSGTMTTASIRDYEHLARWTLGGPNTPLPMTFPEMDLWSLALDEREGKTQADPGAIYEFMCTPEERMQGRPGARTAFRRRLTSTAGIVLTDGASCDASLVFRAFSPPVPRELLDEVNKMRDLWQSPNGEWFDDALTRDRHTRTMLTGFYGYWDPPAPFEWLDARKAWAQACRYILAHNQRNLDSAEPVMNAIDAGHYPHAKPILEAWRAIKPTYEPNPKPVWLSYYLIDWLRGHLSRAEPTLVWCPQVPFARELARVTGLPYYGRQGIDEKTGRIADEADPTMHAILSTASNDEGRNMQQFHRNIMVSPLANNKGTEQIISRTHRRFQTSDEVYFDFVVNHPAHLDALDRVFRQAAYGQSTILGRQKILMGNWI